ncbi:hypothetical protein HDU67_008239 [Dinochytrium kinnereticum]|nr:hypothetical protein HDU67_008239 [Dinochytrium kinnereticum]
MKWWVIRLTALERLRLFDILFVELDAMGNLESPEFSQSFHPEVFPEPKGSIISFDLRFFWARSPALKGNHNDAMSRLFRLSYSLRKEPRTGEEDEKLHQSRQTNIQLCIVGILLEVKDYRLAVSLLESFVVSQPRNFRMLSALGRVHLQYGGVSEARRCFERVEVILRKKSGSGEPEKEDDFDNYDVVLANRAFLAIADGDWESAAQSLNDLIARDPSNATAINNLAVCHLYMGDVSRAISFLESVIVEMPRTAGANTSMLFNVSTLFDLADRSLERKQRLITNVISKSAGDDLDVACLKLGA